MPNAMGVEQKLFASTICLDLGSDTVPDTTWSSKKQFLRLKSALYTSIIKVHRSRESNNSLCPQVKYVSTTNPLHTQSFSHKSTHLTFCINSQRL